MLQRCLKAKATGSWDCLKMAPPPRGLSVHSFLPGLPSFGAPSLRALATLSGYPLLSWTRVERNQGVNPEGKATAFPVFGEHFGDTFGLQNSGARSHCGSFLTLCMPDSGSLSSPGGALQGGPASPPLWKNFKV